jgi:hypothetical protein
VRIAASQHDTKAAPLIEALVRDGHQLVPGPADAFLVDLDTKWNKPLYDARLARGEKVFLYPHAYNTAFLYDGCMDADERVTAHFVVGEGVQEVYRRIGMTVPTYAIGFPWSELRPFRASAAPRRVLFAPEHPLPSGYIRPEHAARNRAVFEALLELDVELTVRHVMALELNGLYHVDGVRFVDASRVEATVQIDSADAVLAVGSFAALSVARGAPTVMFDQSEQPENDNADGTRWTPASWDRWGDYARYPYDFADGPLADLVADAAANDARIREWRDRFIGKPFDPGAFAALFAELCQEPVQESEVRERVVVAWAEEIARRPDLLARYARDAADDHTTLVLYGPDGDQDVIVPALEASFAGCGLAADALPDMLLTVLPRHEVHERTLARRAAAVLTDRDVDGPLADLPSALAPDASSATRV